MLEKGDLVRFKSRTQAMNYMIVEEVNNAPLFGDTRYKLRYVQGWWTEGNLEKIGNESPRDRTQSGQLYGMLR